LEIKKQDVSITGKAVEAITINGSIHGTTLRFKEGEDVVLKVKNSMAPSQINFLKNLNP